MQTLDSLRLSLPFSVLGKCGSHSVFKNPPVTDRPIFLANGGLGDILLSLGVAQEFERFTGEKVIFYCRHPEVAKLFAALDIRHQDQFTTVGADWWITVNTLVLFTFQNNFQGFKNNKVEQAYMNYSAFLARGDWNFLVNNLPLMENIVGTRALTMGLNRQRLPYEMLGLVYLDRGNQKPKSFSYSRALSSPYITIHDGFDPTNEHVKERSTKNWTLQSWEILVQMIKGVYPDLKIVQLGAENSPLIDGVDYNMVGKLSVVESLKVLSGSELHIDCESGLVHAAHMMGVRSVVMFGPTNFNFFKYEDNFNIPPKFCGDCWWVKPDWMGKCVLGYIAPLCMESIKEKDVMEQVRNALH